MTTWPPTPILLGMLVGIVAGAIYLVLFGAKYGWGELRAPEPWAVAALVGIGSFLVAILHPGWMPHESK